MSDESTVQMGKEGGKEGREGGKGKISKHGRSSGTASRNAP